MIDSGLWETDQERIACQRDEPELYPNIWEGKPDDSDGQHKLLPYALVAACVEAYRKGLAPKPGAHRPRAGLDLAEGGADKCALVIATGPTIEYLDVWPGTTGDLRPAAVRAHDACMEHEVEALFYDASSQILGDFRRLGAPYALRGEWFGGEVRGKDVLLERGRPPRSNDQVFRNRAIQMAHALRLRAQRTVRLLKGGDVDPHQCLFINPDCIAVGSIMRTLDAYLADLSTPIRRIPPGSGKWELDKRGGDEMAESPDPFDGTCLAFAGDSLLGLRAR